MSDIFSSLLKEFSTVSITDTFAKNSQVISGTQETKSMPIQNSAPINKSKKRQAIDEDGDIEIQTPDNKIKQRQPQTPKKTKKYFTYSDEELNLLKFIKTIKKIISKQDLGALYRLTENFDIDENVSQENINDIITDMYENNFLDGLTHMIEISQEFYESVKENIIETIDTHNIDENFLAFYTENFPDQFFGYVFNDVKENDLFGKITKSNIMPIFMRELGNYMVMKSVNNPKYKEFVDRYSRKIITRVCEYFENTDITLADVDNEVLKGERKRMYNKEYNLFKDIMDNLDEEYVVKSVFNNYPKCARYFLKYLKYKDLVKAFDKFDI